MLCPVLIQGNADPAPWMGIKCGRHLLTFASRPYSILLLSRLKVALIIFARPAILFIWTNKMFPILNLYYEMMEVALIGENISKALMLWPLLFMVLAVIW